MNVLVFCAEHRLVSSFFPSLPSLPSTYVRPRLVLADDCREYLLSLVTAFSKYHAQRVTI